MKHLLLILCMAFYPLTIRADALQFTAPLTVTTATTGIFIHLDSSGRRSLAVSDEAVAVIWEDNRSGKPGIYIAYHLPGKKTFNGPDEISQQSPAYEPAIAALTGQRFLVAWEAEDQVWLRVVSPSKKGETAAIGRAPAKQITVATTKGGQAGAAWSQGQQRDAHVYYAAITINDYAIEDAPPQLVDNSKDKDVQQYPALAFTKLGKVIAWEDRRQGATRIFSAFSPGGKAFQDYHLLNEFAPSPNPELGKGSGAMRPVLASDGRQTVVAAWMDKRNWRSGYDVYAALSVDGGKKFGANEQAQDMFGENVPQWHASIALSNNADVAAVAWDDTRNENPDVFYSLRVEGEWSEDYELPGASGAGRQSHPVIAFDEQGILHAVWLDSVDSQTRLQYARSVK